MGSGPEDGHLKTASPTVLSIVEKAAVGSALCQTGMGFPMQQPSTAELQCSTEKPAPPWGRQTQGIMQLACWHSRCLAPISFLPCVGHFNPQCGELKYCPPNVLNVLSVLWGMRCCKPGWAARASQKGGSWQQAALPNVFSQPLIKLWDSFYSCAVLEKLEACMDLHDGRVCPWVYRRGKLLAFLYKEYDQRQLATYFWYSPLQFLRWHLRAPTSI